MTSLKPFVIMTEYFKDLGHFPLVLKKARKKSVNRCRFMSKHGHLNLQLRQVPYYKYFRFTKDFATTLVVIQWRWVTLFVIVANFFFYLIFAGLWMLDAWISGDFDGAKSGNFCVVNSGQHFTGFLLLSIETITTTGYGYLYPTEHCQFAWVILTLNTLVMILIDGAFISVVFLKICKPLKRDALTIFSKKSVVSLRNGKLCLVLRINDHLNKHLIGTQITLYFIDRKIVNESNFHVGLQEMEIISSGMLLWPTDVVHVIDENSPMWNLSATDVMNNKFEIFATVSGTSLVTNQPSTSQTSYLTEEVLWGYRFKSCLEWNEKTHQYIINEKDIFKIIPCDTPLCSAQKLTKIKYELENKKQAHITIKSTLV